MRPVPALALAVLLVVLAAGCSGPAADGPAALPAQAPSPSDPAAPAANANATASQPVAVTAAFAWSGHTKEGAWVCMEQSGIGQCLAGQQVAPDGQHAGMVPYAGNLTGLDLTMTWQADATQTGLVLAVYGNTTGGHALLAWAEGDSPLSVTLDATGLGVQPDGALLLAVWPEGKTPTSPSVFVDATQQAFTVEGTLTLRR
jgi:hypothetical protein